MAEPLPTVRYTGVEVCPKCGANDITASHDKERGTMLLACRKCAGRWEVLPLDDVS